MIFHMTLVSPKRKGNKKQNCTKMIKYAFFILLCLAHSLTFPLLFKLMFSCSIRLQLSFVTCTFPFLTEVSTPNTLSCCKQMSTFALDFPCPEYMSTIGGLLLGVMMHQMVKVAINLNSPFPFPLSPPNEKCTSIEPRATKSEI